MAQLQYGSFTTSLASLYKKGLRYSTVIDIGCADGNFFIDHFDLGIFPGAKPLNIDANALYEPSLREIQDVLGGSYVIAAVTDAPGEIELTNSVHPYWASIRPPDDPYWVRVNGLHAGTTRVKALALDSIVAAEKLSGPFLLKLDVQGAEEKALHGAHETLKQTDTVIVEADIADFQAIHAALTAADFSLYDLTTLNWIQDGSLGWFYPVYLNNRRNDLKAAAFWNTENDQAVIENQVARRKTLLSSNAFKLSKFRQMFPKNKP
jgi:FkbM family methyltransferase